MIECLKKIKQKLHFQQLSLFYLFELYSFHDLLF